MGDDDAIPVLHCYSHHQYAALVAVEIFLAGSEDASTWKCSCVLSGEFLQHVIRHYDCWFVRKAQTFHHLS